MSGNDAAPSVPAMCTACGVELVGDCGWDNYPALRSDDPRPADCLVTRPLAAVDEAVVSLGSVDNIRLSDRNRRAVATPASRVQPIEVVPLERFAATDEPGTEALAVTSDGATAIPAGGDVMFFGGGGAGKTTLEIDLTFALASGKTWLDTITPVRPLRIAIIENEGPRSEFRLKLRRKLAHHGADALDGRVIVLAEPWAEFTLGDETHRAMLADALNAHEADMLVAGPLVSMGMIGGGTPDEVRAFEELITDLRARVGRPLAIVLVHHENRAGQISGAWDRVPDVLIHVSAQENGRTRLYWQKARFASVLHGARMQLVWGDGETYTVTEAKEAVTDEAMREGLIAAALNTSGGSWRTIRKQVTGTAEKLAEIRDELLREGVLVNVPPRNGGFGLWHSSDPSRNGSGARTASEPLTDLAQEGPAEAERFAVRLRSREPLEEPNRSDRAGANPVDDDLDAITPDEDEDGQPTSTPTPWSSVADDADEVERLAVYEDMLDEDGEP